MPRIVSYTIQDVSPANVTSLSIRFEKDNCEVNVAYDLVDAGGVVRGSGVDGFALPRAAVADVEAFFEKQVMSRIASKEGLAVKAARLA